LGIADSWGSLQTCKSNICRRCSQKRAEFKQPLNQNVAALCFLSCHLLCFKYDGWFRHTSKV